MDPNAQELLTFFKALADANRLKIVGLLARGSYSVEQLAEMLTLRPSTISHHLSRLVDAGLVSARSESYYSIYQLETDSLERLARQLLSRETWPVIAADVDVEAYDRKVIQDYSLPDGRLKIIPAQRKKLEAILRYVAKAFSPSARYSEKEVNEILADYHVDTATLRRELVGYRILERDKDGGVYWKAKEKTKRE